jgi:hypothetical protein
MFNLNDRVWIRGGQESKELQAMANDDRALVLQWHYGCKQYQVLDNMDEVVEDFTISDKALYSAYTTKGEHQGTKVWVNVSYLKDKQEDTNFVKGSFLAMELNHFTTGHVRILKRECMVCRKHTDNICAKCRRVVVCSKACMKSSWSLHKKVCRAPKNQENFT